jgi:hypothetical protein
MTGELLRQAAHAVTALHPIPVLPVRLSALRHGGDAPPTNNKVYAFGLAGRG